MASKEVEDACEGVDLSTKQQLQTSSTSSTLREASTSSSSTMPSTPDEGKKRKHRFSISSKSECYPEKKKKCLRWSTITVHEFGVGLGGSSVPSKGGPSIGLSDKPEFTWTTKVGTMAECVEGVNRFTSEERVQLLQNAGVSEAMILRYSRETNIINCSRRKTLVEDIAGRKRAKKQKRLHLESTCPVLERPCSSFISHSHMIPVKYV